MITFLILIFTALQSPLAWGKPLLPFVCYGIGIAVVGFVAYETLRGQVPTTPLDFHLLLLWLVALISFVYSIWPEGSQIRVLTIMGYIAAYYFVYMGISEETLTRQVIRAGWILIVTYLIFGLFRLWVPPKSLHDLGNSNVLASILLLILPFGANVQYRNGQWVWFLAGTVAMVVTRSRGGLLGLLMAMGVLWKVDKRLIALIGGVSLPVLFILKRSSAMIRLCYWQAAWEAFLTRPLFGIGPGSCYQWITKRCELCPHAHNIFLTFLAEMGLAGLVCLVLLLWQIWRHRRPGPVWAALVGFMVHSLVDDPIWFWAPGLGVMSLLAIMVRDDG